MWETIIKITSVYFSSMIKFILGPIGGYAARLNLFTTIVTTVAGMMTVVLVFTFFGNWLRKNIFVRFTKKESRFSIRNKKFVTIWKKYGLVGVAALTPLILTPIGGTILAVSSGSPREKIIFYMFVSATVWAVIFSGLIYFFGSQIIKEFPEIITP